MEFQCANIIKYLVLLKCVLVDGSDRLDNNYVIRLQVITIVAIIVIRIIAYGQMISELPVDMSLNITLEMFMHNIALH